MPRILIFVVIIVGVLIWTQFSNNSGGGGNAQPANWTNIDLDRVLEVTEQTLAEAPPADLASAVAADAPTGTGVAADGSAAATGELTSFEDVEAIDLVEDAEAAVVTGAFLERLSDNLNAADLHSQPIETVMMSDGSLMGFEDGNGNLEQDPGEKGLFTVQLDAANDRLIASDLQDPEVHRDAPYRPSMGGFFTGYLIGSMLGGQRRAFGPAGPNFNNTRMAPRGYARSGSNFQTRRSAARNPAPARNSRSSGGSRSFLGGK